LWVILVRARLIYLAAHVLFTSESGLSAVLGDRWTVPMVRSLGDGTGCCGTVHDARARFGAQDKQAY